MKICEADHCLKEQVNRFYLEEGYHGNWSDRERAFVCITENVIIGSVKVELLNNVAILRGMYVNSAYQRRGIGAQLLKHIEPILNESTAYCMPLAHVAD